MNPNCTHSLSSPTLTLATIVDFIDVHFGDKPIAAPASTTSCQSSNGNNNYLLPTCHQDLFGLDDLQLQFINRPSEYLDNTTAYTAITTEVQTLDSFVKRIIAFDFGVSESARKIVAGDCQEILQRYVDLNPDISVMIFEYITQPVLQLHIEIITRNTTVQYETTVFIFKAQKQWYSRITNISQHTFDVIMQLYYQESATASDTDGNNHGSRSDDCVMASDSGGECGYLDGTEHALTNNEDSATQKITWDLSQTHQTIVIPTVTDKLATIQSFAESYGIELTYESAKTRKQINKTKQMLINELKELIANQV